MFTGGITVLVAVRGAQALSAFTSNVQGATIATTQFNAALALSRNGMIKWGLAAAGMMGVASIFKSMVDNAAKLETAMAGVQAITNATSKDMGDIQRAMLKSTERTELTTAQVGAMAYSLAAGSPTAFRGANARNLIGVLPVVAEGASLLQRVPGKEFDPMATTKVVSAMINRYLPDAQKTEQNMATAARLTTGALYMAPYASPEQLQTRLSYFSRAPYRMDPMAEIAFSTALQTGGVVGGRGAALPGRSLDVLTEIMFGSITKTGARGRGGGGLNAILGLTGRGGAADNLTTLRNAFGLGPAIANARATGKIDMPFLLRTMQTRTRGMSLDERQATVTALGAGGQQIISALIDPAKDFAKAMEDSTKRLYEFLVPGQLEALNNKFLTTFEGAWGMFTSNITDLAAVLGMPLIPALADTAFWFANIVTQIRSLSEQYPGTISAIVKLAAAATAAATTLSFMAVGHAAGGFLTTVGSSIAVGGAASMMSRNLLMGAGRALPWLAGGTGMALSGWLALPLLFSAYDTIMNPLGKKKTDATDPNDDLAWRATAARGLQATHPLIAHGIRSGKLSRAAAGEMIAAASGLNVLAAGVGGGPPAVAASAGPYSGLMGFGGSAGGAAVNASGGLTDFGRMGGPGDGVGVGIPAGGRAFTLGVNGFQDITDTFVPFGVSVDSAASSLDALAAASAAAAQDKEAMDIALPTDPRDIALTQDAVDPDLDRPMWQLHYEASKVIPPEWIAGGTQEQKAKSIAAFGKNLLHFGERALWHTGGLMTDPVGTLGAFGQSVFKPLSDLPPARALGKTKRQHLEDIGQLPPPSTNASVNWAGVAPESAPVNADATNPLAGERQRSVTLKVGEKQMDATFSDWEQSMSRYEAERGARTTASGEGYSPYTARAARRSRGR